MYERPNTAAFKSYFVRDFPYADNSDGVMDEDVGRALLDAEISINEALFGDQTTFTVAFLTLAAHHLVMNLRTSSQGVESQPSWLQSSRSAGGVSESFSIPQQIMEHPVLALLSKTGYGIRYLELALPGSVGAGFIVKGTTNA